MFECSAIGIMHLAEPLAKPNAEHFQSRCVIFQAIAAKPSDEGVRTLGSEQASCL